MSHIKMKYTIRSIFLLIGIIYAAQIKTYRRRTGTDFLYFFACCYVLKHFLIVHGQEHGWLENKFESDIVSNMCSAHGVQLFVGRTICRVKFLWHVHEFCCCFSFIKTSFLFWKIGVKHYLKLITLLFILQGTFMGVILLMCMNTAWNLSSKH